MKSSIKFCGNIPSICFNSFLILERSEDFKAPPFFSVCFSKTFPKGEHTNLACSIICLWLEGNISSPVRYYLSISPDDNADIFAASPSISYCYFSSLILSSIVMISFYIPSKRFSLKQKRLSDATVASIAKKEYGFAIHFYIDLQSLESQYLMTN